MRFKYTQTITQNLHRGVGGARAQKTRETLTNTSKYVDPRQSELVLRMGTS